MRTGNIDTMVARAITVVQILPDLESGGVERGTVELGAYLSQKGHRSLVISAGGRMAPRLEKEGSRHISWTIGRKRPSSLKYIPQLRRLLIEERADILHLRSRLPAWIGYLVWRSLPEKLRPRLVTTFHGFYSVNAYSAVMTKGERVIAISKTVAEHIQDRYGVPAGRIVLIYRGFDETIFNPEAVSARRKEALKENWGLGDPATPVIMLPGRLTRWKGQDVFIDALARVRHLPWTAVCVGDKHENPAHAAQMEKMIAQLNLEQRIKLVGHCEDMPAALMVADVVVSASSTEPEAFGRIAVEAQAMGRAVIASAHGGSLETVLDRRTGWLVTPCDPESLAEALHEAISDKALRNRLGSNGRKWVGENFTVQKMCEKTLGVYLELVKEKQGAFQSIQ